MAIFYKPQKVVACSDNCYFTAPGRSAGFWRRIVFISLYLFAILMERKKNLETILVLVLACVVVYEIRKVDTWLLVAMLIGIIGLFVPWAAAKIHWAWMKLAEGMGFVMSKVLLTLIYYIILMPLSVFARLHRNKQARKKAGGTSYFVTRDFLYTKESMEKMW
jgi:hypothetical protein